MMPQLKHKAISTLLFFMFFLRYVDYQRAQTRTRSAYFRMQKPNVHVKHKLEKGYETPRFLKKRIYVLTTMSQTLRFLKEKIYTHGRVRIGAFRLDFVSFSLAGLPLEALDSSSTISSSKFMTGTCTCDLGVYKPFFCWITKHF